MDFNLFERDHFSATSNPNIWWFNVAQRRRVFVDRHDDHFSHIARNPYLYEVAPRSTQRETKEAMYNNGWVRLRYANEGELNVEGPNLRSLRRAITDAQQLGHQIQSVFVEITNGDYWVLNENDIDLFVKYGRNP